MKWEKKYQNIARYWGFIFEFLPIGWLIWKKKKKWVAWLRGTSTGCCPPACCYPYLYTPLYSCTGTRWPGSYRKYIMQITQPSQYGYAKLQYRFAVTSWSPSTCSLVLCSCFSSWSRWSSVFPQLGHPPSPTMCFLSFLYTDTTINPNSIGWGREGGGGWQCDQNTKIALS